MMVCLDLINKNIFIYNFLLFLSNLTKKIWEIWFIFIVFFSCFVQRSSKESQNVKITQII